MGERTPNRNVTRFPRPIVQFDTRKGVRLD